MDLQAKAWHLLPDEEASLSNIIYNKPDQVVCELLSPWCASDTPTLWHPDYSRDWTVSGCAYKANCNQVGIATKEECCARYYGGTGGECTTLLPGASSAGGTNWYADYGTAWAMAGCKSETPYPIYASTFYDTQLACCKAAYAGQSSGACIKGLASPPTSSPTKPGDFGTDWYADYATSWAIAGCKNTLPRPNYAIQLYKTEQECCKAAYGGQATEACVQGLPNPPTKKPSMTPTNRPTKSTPPMASTPPTTSSPIPCTAGAPGDSLPDTCPTESPGPDGFATGNDERCCSGVCATEGVNQDKCC
jgi:hypothetical protein